MADLHSIYSARKVSEHDLGSALAERPVLLHERDDPENRRNDNAGLDNMARRGDPRARCIDLICNTVACPTLQRDRAVRRVPHNVGLSVSVFEPFLALAK